MFDKKGNGYIANKMSVNAANAYVRGEMPLSKWTKAEILDVASEFTNLDLSKLTLSELRQYMLNTSSWHHTGALFNTTVFYEINQDYISSLTVDDVNMIIQRRPAKIKKTSEEKEKEARVALEKRFARQAQKNGQNPYFINKKLLRNCTFSEIEDMIEVLQNIEENYKKYNGKIKTLRGYTNSILKGE